MDGLHDSEALLPYADHGDLKGKLPSYLDQSLCCHFAQKGQGLA